MQMPDWFKPALWGAAGGAIALSIFGFSQLGWKSASSAEQFAQERSDTAVVTAMVPFCVAKAQGDADPAVMVKFKAETSSYSRSDIVSKAGWATLGGARFSDSALARACSDSLYTAKS